MEEIEKYLDTLYIREDLVITPKPCIIIYKGNRIQLNNGKSIWLNIGAARAAFSNMINHKLNKTSTSQIRKGLEDKGILVFEEL